jgi:hypothetical protein
VRQRTRLKNQAQAVSHRNLAPVGLSADLLEIKGPACALALIGAYPD